MVDTVILESRPLFEILWIDGIKDSVMINCRLDKGWFAMGSNNSNSDEEWRKRGVEFKIIDEGGTEKEKIVILNVKSTITSFWDK